ncbi:hypothetical protein [uncultured Dialister sp.]|uniref:hypothetical protein n=1 Tax=Dialister succinatiphilus TaxID=487173 RepID=UPI00266F9222|nr:hypothetical protein [uncultured Dialister sp.]
MYYRAIQYKYRSLRQLKEDIISGYEPIKGPIVTAYTATAKVLDGKIPAHILSFNSLLSPLLGKWMDSSFYFQQLIQVYQSIRSFSKDSSPEARKALYDHANDLLCVCRDFIEIGVLPEHLPQSNEEFQSNEELELFKKIYVNFREHYNLFPNLDSMLRYWEKHPERFKEKLLEVHPGFFEAKSVYFQGFYYIKPIQDRIIQLFQYAGMQVCFFVHEPETEASSQYYYDKIWKENSFYQYYALCDQLGYSDPLGDKIFPGNFKLQLKEKQFTDIFSFVDYINSQKQKTAVFCPVCKKTETMVDTFFNGKPLKKKLLSYPLGQYIYTLYHIGRNNDDYIELSDMRECIASGWGDEWNPRCLDAFDHLQYFFKDCRTLNEWANRVKELSCRTDDLWPYSEDYVQYVYFRSHPKEAMELFLCIASILLDFKNLFEAKDLSTSLEELKTIIENRIEKKKPKGLDASIAKELLNRIKQVPTDLKTNDHLAINKAVAFILGGDSREYDDPDGNYIHEAESANPNVSFYTVPEVEIAQLLDKGTKCIMAFCDSDHMPGSGTSYPWPINHDVIDHIVRLAKNEMVCRLAEDYMYYKECTVSANRYNFFLAYQASLREESMEFTWIESDGAKELAPSPYLQLAEEGKKMQSPKEGVPDANSDLYYDYDYNVPRMQGEIPQSLNYLLYSCPTRYLYGWKFGQHWDYTDGFLISHYISSLFKSVYIDDNGTGHKYSDSKKKNKIFTFFNMLTQVEKNNCFRFYPKTAYPFHPTKNLSVLHRDKPTKDKCLYCPYKKVCLEYMNRIRAKKD